MSHFARLHALIIDIVEVQSSIKHLNDLLEMLPGLNMDLRTFLGRTRTGRTHGVSQAWNN
jgi:hypothetical protein